MSQTQSLRVSVLVAPPPLLDTFLALRQAQLPRLRRGNLRHVGPRKDCLNIAAPDASSDDAAGEGDGLRLEADDVVALDADARGTACGR